MTSLSPKSYHMAGTCDVTDENGVGYSTAEQEIGISLSVINL